MTIIIRISKEKERDSTSRTRRWVTHRQQRGRKICYRVSRRCVCLRVSVSGASNLFPERRGGFAFFAFVFFPCHFLLSFLLHCIVKAKHSRQKDVHVWFRGMDVLLLLLDLFHPPALLQEHDTCFRSLCAPCAGSGFLCFVGFTWWYHVCLSCVCVCGCILGLRQCCKAVRGREERRGEGISTVCKHYSYRWICVRLWAERVRAGKRGKAERCYIHVSALLLACRKR